MAHEITSSDHMVSGSNVPREHILAEWHEMMTNRINQHSNLSISSLLL